MSNVAWLQQPRRCRRRFPSSWPSLGLAALGQAGGCPAAPNPCWDPFHLHPTCRRLGYYHHDVLMPLSAVPWPGIFDHINYKPHPRLLLLHFIFSALSFMLLALPIPQTLRRYKQFELFKEISNIYAYNVTILSFHSSSLLHCDFMWFAVIQEKKKKYGKSNPLYFTVHLHNYKPGLCLCSTLPAHPR